MNMIKKIVALLLGAVTLIGCGGNPKNVQKESQDTSKAETKVEETKEDLIVKAWQQAAVTEFTDFFDVVRTTVESISNAEIDEAAEQGIDCGNYKEIYAGLVKTLDEYRDKIVEKLNNTKPYDVPEYEYINCQDILHELIGTPGDPRKPDSTTLESLFRRLTDYAVNGTPPPATDLEVFDEDEVRAFLSKVFPNSLDPEDLPEYEAITTDRFREHSSLSCEYDPVYMTQDAYAYDVLPNPTISKFNMYPNAYVVGWDRYPEEDRDHVLNIVVVTKKDGKYLIDNILSNEGGHCFLLFDYSRKPESIWAE